MIKLFLSHASEDQKDFVRPLAKALSKDTAFKVWYSEYELTLGDRLLHKIEQGLTSCDYGVVVLSTSFFSKRWPREELEGLFGLETLERKVILPIWKDVSEHDVRVHSPILAGRLGVDAKVGIEKVVSEIKRAVGLVDRYKTVSVPNWKLKVTNLDQRIVDEKQVKDFSETGKARTQVESAATALFESARKMASETTEGLSSIKLSSKTPSPNIQGIDIIGPKRLLLVLRYDSIYTNSLEGTRITALIVRDRRDYSSEKPNVLLKREFKPDFTKALEVVWTNADQAFSNEQLLDFVFERFVEKLESVIGSSEA